MSVAAAPVAKPTREERKAAKKAAKKAERKAEKQALKEKVAETFKSSESEGVEVVRAHHDVHHDVHHEAHHEVHHEVHHDVHHEVHVGEVHTAVRKHRERDEQGNYVVTTKQHFADRIVAIPEIVRREVVEEAYVAVPRKVVEKEKVIMVKEVVEIPEIEYVDEYVTEEYVQDVHRTIEKPVTIEKEVEHIVHVDDIETIVVEVPDVTYDDVVVVKDVPVPTIVEKEIVVERVVPQIQEEIIEDVNYVYKDREVRRNIPVPVEATIKQKFIAPRIESVHKDRTYKVLLPEFSEQAVWSSSITAEGQAVLPAFQNRINQLAGSSLCEVEKLFCDIKAVKMEHDDWLTSEMFHSRMNLPYMGVENININKPVFVKNEEAHEVFHPQTSIVEQQTKGSKFCKPKKTRTAPTTAAHPQATVVKSQQPQFIQVDSHLGHTTISPTANYARRTVATTH